MGFGVPSYVRACLFDLDGVLTPTAKVHAAAWKEMFDAYLRARARDDGATFFAAVVWGPLVALRDSDASPCEGLRLQTEAVLAAVASKQRQNAAYTEALDYVSWNDRVVATARIGCAWTIGPVTYNSAPPTA